MELTCIKCPVGCRISVDENMNVSGNECPRGKLYVEEELTRPMRTLTTLVMADGLPVSVKTDGQIPKERMGECLAKIKSVELRLPVDIGQVIMEDLCGTGVDVVATKTIHAQANNK